MKKIRKNKIKIVAGILISFALIGFVGCSNKEVNSDINNEVSEYNEPEHSLDVDNVESNKQPLNVENKEVIKEKKTVSNKEQNVENSKPLEATTQEEKEVMLYFNNVNREVKETVSQKNSSENENKLKGTFITIVDFIFYDAEINGIKFNDLSDGVKQNILETAQDIDSTIMKKYPNYKETIGSKTKNAYKKASELISKGSKKISDFSKQKLGEENYNAIIEAKDELKHYTKSAVSIIGEGVSDVWNSGKSKLKNWYENFKEE